MQRAYPIGRACCFYEGVKIPMEYKTICLREVEGNLVQRIAEQWMLVAAGDESGYNMMTASWGGTGEMWGHDIAVAVVRPTRYTYEFLERSDYFTLSFFDETWKQKVHSVCGSQSGRDIDKTKATGLTPIFDHPLVRFAEAELTFCLRKIYVSDLDPKGFLDPTIAQWYEKEDYHRMYVGAVEDVIEKIG